MPLKSCHLKNREAFSRYVYNLHELVNKKLKKKSGLTYCDVRERYEHFRARCSKYKLKINYLSLIKKQRKLEKTERQKVKTDVLNHYMVRNQSV